jgi:hypothetical protein
VRANDQVIAVNGQVAHRGVGQVQLQRLPGITIVKGDEDRRFGPGKE